MATTASPPRVEQQTQTQQTTQHADVASPEPSGRDVPSPWGFMGGYNRVPQVPQAAPGFHGTGPYPAPNLDHLYNLHHHQQQQQHCYNHPQGHADAWMAGLSGRCSECSRGSCWSSPVATEPVLPVLPIHRVTGGGGFFHGFASNTSDASYASRATGASRASRGSSSRSRASGMSVSACEVCLEQLPGTSGGCLPGTSGGCLPDYTLSCGHRFHLGCISLWLDQNHGCPSCGRTVSPLTRLMMARASAAASAASAASDAAAAASAYDDDEANPYHPAAKGAWGGYNGLLLGGMIGNGVKGECYSSLAWMFTAAVWVAVVATAFMILDGLAMIR